jgi:hypothetical protein
MFSTNYTCTCIKCQEVFQSVEKLNICLLCFEAELVKKYALERFWCVYCGFDMTALGVCVDCNEYKSAVTFDEYVEMNGVEPKVCA